MYDPTYVLMCVKATAAKTRRLIAEKRFDDLMANGTFNGDYMSTKETFRKANTLEEEWKLAVAAEQEIRFAQIKYAYKNWRTE